MKYLYKQRMILMLSVTLFCLFCLNYTPLNASTGASADVSYTIVTDWGSGATVNISIKNTGTTIIQDWTLAWNFTGNQKITNIVSAKFKQTGTNVVVNSDSYNGVIQPGTTINIIINIIYSGTNAIPTGFTLNEAGGASNFLIVANYPVVHTVTSTSTEAVSKTFTISANSVNRFYQVDYYYMTHVVKGGYVSLVDSNGNTLISSNEEGGANGTISLEAGQTYTMTVRSVYNGSITSFTLSYMERIKSGFNHIIRRYDMDQAHNDGVDNYTTLYLPTTEAFNGVYEKGRVTRGNVWNINTKNDILVRPYEIKVYYETNNSRSSNFSIVRCDAQGNTGEVVASGGTTNGNFVINQGHGVLITMNSGHAHTTEWVEKDIGGNCQISLRYRLDEAAPNAPELTVKNLSDSGIVKVNGKIHTNVPLVLQWAKPEDNATKLPDGTLIGPGGVIRYKLDIYQNNRIVRSEFINENSAGNIFTTKLFDGEYLLNLRAYDLDNNVGPVSNSIAIVSDCSVNQVNISESAIKLEGNSLQVGWEMVEDISDIFEYQIALTTTQQEPDTYQIKSVKDELSYTFNDLSGTSTYYLWIRAVDKLGNIGAWTTSGPLATSVNPVTINAVPSATVTANNQPRYQVELNIKNAAAMRYIIQRKAEGSASSVVLAELTHDQLAQMAFKYIDAQNLTKRGRYTYSVIAQGFGGAEATSSSSLVAIPNIKAEYTISGPADKSATQTKTQTFDITPKVDCEGDTLKFRVWTRLNKGQPKVSGALQSEAISLTFPTDGEWEWWLEVAEYTGDQLLGKASNANARVVFIRSTNARQEDGTQVAVNQPRYQSSKIGFGKAVWFEEGTRNMLASGSGAYSDCDFVNSALYASDEYFRLQIVNDPEIGPCLEIEVLKDTGTWKNAVRLSENIKCKPNVTHNLALRYKVLECQDNASGLDAHGELGVWTYYRDSGNNDIAYPDLVFWKDGSSNRNEYGKWKVVQYPSVSPENTTHARFDIGVGSVKAGTKFRVDWIQFEQKTYASSFDEGSTNLLASGPNAYPDCDFENGNFYTSDENFRRQIVEDPEVGPCLEIEVLKDQTTWKTSDVLSSQIYCIPNASYNLALRYKVINCQDNTSGQDAHGELGLWSHYHDISGASIAYPDLVFWKDGSSDVNNYGKWQVAQVESIAPGNTAFAHFSLGTGAVKAGTKFRLDWVVFEPKPDASKLLEYNRDHEKVSIGLKSKDATQGTIEALVYIDAKIRELSQNRYIFAAAAPTSPYGNRISLRHSTSNSWILTSSNASATSTSVRVNDSLSEGWHRFKAIWSTSELALYIDNVKVGSATSPSLPSVYGSDLYIGSWSSGTYGMPNTVIDDIRISSIARTDSPDLDKPLPVDDYTICKTNFDGNPEPEYLQPEIRTLTIQPPVSTGVTLPAIFETSPGASLQLGAKVNISGQAVEYRWTPGDGGSDFTRTQPVYTYNKVGDYTLTLKVKDNNGQVYTATSTVQVRNTAAGTVKGNETWSGTHLVTGDLVISSGTTVIVQAGTVIKMTAGSSLKIDGNFQASDSNKAIVIKTEDGSLWQGVIVSGAGTVNLTGVTIEGAKTGIACIGSGQVTLSNTTLQNCQVGLHAYSGTVKASSCIFKNNKFYGVKEDNGCNPVMTSCQFQSNGIHYYDEQLYYITASQLNTGSNSGNVFNN